MLTAEFTADTTSVDDPAYIVIRSYDDGHSPFGPVAWAPRVDDAGAPVYPQAADIAFVEESDLGEWVVLTWRPRTAEDD